MINSSDSAVKAKTVESALNTVFNSDLYYILVIDDGVDKGVRLYSMWDSRTRQIELIDAIMDRLDRDEYRAFMALIDCDPLELNSIGLIADKLAPSLDGAFTHIAKKYIH